MITARPLQLVAPLLALLLAAPPAAAKEPPPPSNTFAPAPANLQGGGRKADPQLPAATDGLDAAAVQQALASQRVHLDDCATRAARGRKGPSTLGEATLRLKVQPSGRVSSAQLADAKVKDRQLRSCLVKAGRQLSFPAFRGPPVDLEIPLDLTVR
ncbi:MAG: AgmX/PglI C-terminal domain-containing protein [Anaeromyxobacter sp.]